MTKKVAKKKKSQSLSKSIGYVFAIRWVAQAHDELKRAKTRTALVELGKKHADMYIEEVFASRYARSGFLNILNQPNGYSGMLFALLQLSAGLALEANYDRGDAMRYGDRFTCSALDEIKRRTGWELPGLKVVDPSELSPDELYEYKRCMGTNTPEDDEAEFERRLASILATNAGARSFFIRRRRSCLPRRCRRRT